MGFNRLASPTPFFLCVLFGACWATPAQAYITAPVVTLGTALTDSTYVTVIRVENISREKGIIIYSKVRDLKGKYPKDTIKHVFDLKGTPQHKGSGDVPVRPDEKDWRYALEWAKAGRTALMFTRKYDPFGDFGHTYIDGCWYATMCPPRDWEHWYAIYADPNLLTRWHAGTPAQLMRAIEAMVAGRDAIVPVLGKGTRDDLRAGKAKLQGLLVSTSLRDYAAQRDVILDLLDAATVPTLIKSLQQGANRDDRIKAARALGFYGPDAKAAVPMLAEAVRNDASGTVRMCAADALAAIGPEARSALPALEACAKDARMAHRQDVLARIAEVQAKLK